MQRCSRLPVLGRLTISLELAWMFEHHLTKLSAFLVHLPGFKSLSTDDRCEIVKGKYCSCNVFSDVFNGMFKNFVSEFLAQFEVWYNL